MRQARYIALAFFVVLFMAAGGTITHAYTEEEIKAQLEEGSKQIETLKNEIAQLQIQLNATTKEKQTLQGAIKELTLSIQRLQKSITLTQTQIKQKDLEIRTLSTTIKDTSGRITASQAQIADSLRQLEAHDDKPMLVTLLGGGTLSSFFDAASTLESVRTELQDHVHTLGNLKTDLVSDKNVAEKKRKELSALHTSLSQQNKGLTIARDSQTKLLQDTKNKESAYQAQLAQKQAEEAAFEAALIRLAAGLGSADTASAPLPAHGILSWPLDSVAITQHFGNTAFAQSGAYSGQGHNGIDFRASVGTPVRSALSGTVQEVNQGAVKNCQYGKWVLVRHNNGLSTLYSHLSNIAVTKGQPVETGDLVGYAGNTGYATGPHLHFTVYVASAVTFRQYTCSSGSSAYIPIVPLNAYLNPLSYLPSI